MKTAGRQWIATLFTPLWRWKWLLLVCLIITGGYGLTSVSQQASEIIFPPLPSGMLGKAFAYTRFGHGWPCEYVERRSTDDAWPSRWTIWSGVDSFHWGPLAVNLAVAAAVGVLLTYLVAWRFLRSYRWQFALSDLFALTILSAAFLGFARRLETNYQADQRYLQANASDCWDVQRDDAQMRHLRPLRDLGLLSDGTLYAVSIRHVRPSFTLPNDWLLQEVNRGRCLRHPVASISIDDPSMRDDGIDALTQWAPSCSQVEIYGGPEFTDAGLRHAVTAWPRLQRLECGSPSLSAASLQSLAKLTELEHLLISDCSREVTPADLGCLDELPQLKRLSLPNFLYEQISPERRADWERRDIAVRNSLYQFLQR